MTDLYELLGVKKTATVKQVREAYRKKAKKAHPDHGGTQEAFAALKLAHDILIDSERRAKYDITGEVAEKPVNNEMSQVIGILATALEKVLAQIEQRGGEPVEFEIVNDMKTMIGADLADIETTRKISKALRAKTEKLIGRFGAKTGENYLEGIITGKLSAIDTNLRMLDVWEEPIKKALDILTNSTFRSDGQSEQKGYGYGSAYRISDLMNRSMSGGF